MCVIAGPGFVLTDERGIGMMGKNNFAAPLLALTGSARVTCWIPLKLCDIRVSNLCYWMALICLTGTGWLDRAS